jgi:hypothetical protein
MMHKKGNKTGGNKMDLELNPRKAKWRPVYKKKQLVKDNGELTRKYNQLTCNLL